VIRPDGYGSEDGASSGDEAPGTYRYQQAMRRSASEEQEEVRAHTIQGFNHFFDNNNNNNNDNNKTKHTHTYCMLKHTLSVWCYQVEDDRAAAASILALSGHWPAAAPDATSSFKGMPDALKRQLSRLVRSAIPHFI
jgi:hypothetical protein